MLAVIQANPYVLYALVAVLYVAESYTKFSNGVEQENLFLARIQCTAEGILARFLFFAVRAPPWAQRHRLHSVPNNLCTAAADGFLLTPSSSCGACDHSSPLSALLSVRAVRLVFLCCA